jgi:stage II sporulation protein P
MSYKGIDFKNNHKNIPSEKTTLSKHRIKTHSNRALYLSIFTLLIIFLLGLILPKRINAYNEEKYPNYFYINVINNVLPVIKCSTKEGQNTNSENSMKFEALSLLGVDIINPISIIVKEIPYLNINEVIPDVNNASKEDKNSKPFVITPFNLGDNQISKSVAEVKDSGVVANLYNPNLKKTLNNAKPEVLIYHSHTTEAYLTSEKDTTKTTFNTDETRNVCAVGDAIEKELEEKYGIAVIHDKTLHNVGDYNAAYKKSGVTLDKYIKEYGDFKLIIDLHRDSVNNKNSVTTKINGENVAQFMFVVADKNPKYAKQEKLINSMIGISNKLYPTLLRKLNVTVNHWGIGFYNQNRSDNAVLIEVGAYSNTIDEAKNTGKYLSGIIAEQLNGKKSN